MNQYSLKFDNEILEQAYLKYFNQSKTNHVYNIIKVNCPMLIILAITCGFMNDYVPSILSSVSFVNNIWFARYVSRINEKKILIYYETLVFITPPLAIIAVYFSNHPKEIGISMIIALVIMVQLLVSTANIALATIQIVVYFIGVLIIIIYTFGWSPYILFWNPLLLFCIYNHYSLIRNQKLLFQQSKVNQSIYTLIKQTAADEIIFFKLNKELLKYELEFTNIENLDLNAFLQSIVIDRKENIKKYLFSKINITNIASDKQQVVGYRNLKEKVKLEIYIQYYPEIRFYIRILKIENTYIEDEAKLIFQFYNKILNKAKNNPYKINFNYIMKMLCAVNAEVQIQRIQSVPYYFQLKLEQMNIVNIIKEQCTNQLVKVYINYDQVLTSEFVSSSKIILETLMYYLIRVVSSQNTIINATFTNLNNNIQIIMNFQHPIHIKILNCSKLGYKINFLQALLSNQPIVLEKHKFICFIDANKDIPYQ